MTSCAMYGRETHSPIPNLTASAVSKLRYFPSILKEQLFLALAFFYYNFRTHFLLSGVV